MTAHAEGRRKRSPFSIAMMTFLVILWTVPTLGLLISSFRPRIEIEKSGWWTALFNPFSTDWTIDNYTGALQGKDMAGSFVNSIAVAIPATILPIMFAAFAAYAFTFMRFWGRDFFFVIIVALMVVPIQAAFVPLLTLLGPDGFGINGTFLAVWFLHTGFGMPLAIYTIRNYMSTLPTTVIESAKIDGATHFQTFWRLIVPMSVPVLAAFAILQFLWVWNDLLIALLFLGSGEQSTVIVNLAGLLGTQGQGAELLTAGAFISMAVPLLVFFGLQRFFVRGLTSGAVKG
ncbi:MAG TPA: carbohydrate ABC transporter permease [Nocardioidaceae bacterium]